MNATRGGSVTGVAEANFAAAGSLETQQETILSTKVPQIERINQEQRRVINNRVTRQVSTNQALTGIRNIVETVVEIEEVEVIKEVEKEVFVDRFIEVPAEPIIRFVDRYIPIEPEPEPIPEPVVPAPIPEPEPEEDDDDDDWNGNQDEDDDPLGQTFTVNDSSGVFITSVDCFFQTKDEELPIVLQVRTVETGLPSTKILPFSVVVVDPADVNVSEDASVPTTFTFDSPVYLQGETRYALVLISASENYNAWISRMGEIDISTVGLPDNQQVVISQQPLGIFI